MSCWVGWSTEDVKGRETQSREGEADLCCFCGQGNVGVEAHAGGDS